MDAALKQAMHSDLADLYLEVRLKRRSPESYREAISKVQDEYRREHDDFRTKDQGW